MTTVYEYVYTYTIYFIPCAQGVVGWIIFLLNRPLVKFSALSSPLPPLHHHHSSSHRKGWAGRYLIKISVAPLEPFSISPAPPLAAARGELMTFASIYTPTARFFFFFNLNLFGALRVRLQ